MSYARDDDELEEEDMEEEEGAPQQVVELASAIVPDNLKHCRACKRCGILKTLGQFHDQGCENCPFLHMAEDHNMVTKCTTAFFEGATAVMDPRDSWAAKWIRVDAYLPGVYAIVVTGQFDRDIEEDLENQGIRWRCRPAAQS
mmetsp:Transcript_13225/g.17305  ORF Transcript_13225/g.17305 Transcript_13225/m.17305 type:complete len:143 (-) Transcript_13225:328-756(-)|eukprot:CAMPEP_0198147788 /NCGR_PEP_ID=MMETSP1443-20131203/37764_1 /TAXON_ID=186043 /ORGANISM="Entomoneis sp., Strain CCMP2396" /LENGTH=142 /DNA_ID=CAMNT_0043812259 /DNA_START=98 /DNA_END=526 /DNA_ORIENTATION=+